MTEFWPTFGIQTWLYFGKTCKATLFRKPTKKRKICVFGGFFFNITIADILNFSWIKYLGKGLSYLKNGGIQVNYCWNYGPSKLLLYFIKYCLDQLNNKHTTTAVNSTIQFFQSRYQKKYLVNVWSFLAQLLQNGGPVKLNGNHLLTANISRVLMKFYYVRYIFDLDTFDNERTALLNFFGICTEMHFVSLFFLNKRNVTTSLLMIYLKCTVTHYANLNSRPIHKPYFQAVE